MIPRLLDDQAAVGMNAWPALERLCTARSVKRHSWRVVWQSVRWKTMVTVLPQDLIYVLEDLVRR